MANEVVGTRHTVFRYYKKHRAETQRIGAVELVRLLQLSAAGEVFRALCRDTACRVRCFCSKENPVENIPPECFQTQGVTSGKQGGAVLFAPPSKSCRFSHPPSPCAKKHGAGNFAVCGRRLRGHVPSKNTSPTALSWISLTGQRSRFFLSLHDAFSTADTAQPVPTIPHFVTISPRRISQTRHLPRPRIPARR